jgi:hypothetical protein
LENFGQAYPDQDWNADAPDCNEPSTISTFVECVLC